ncbi:hypothetical protein JAAARDRAFT_396398 [Jaapia argillacea MUCL 33604]|uniref:Uncharacterized protein n=1 Tax=Jaapia argillacea MUCL 33604 TaxID=933084 RepID=A0A067PHY2_9AGAM|nr:hypothetical protein JAAARDRAFT_396398 [Jaapia argillacea MUCL 33604]
MIAGGHFIGERSSGFAAKFYKEKRRRRGGFDTEYAQCIKITPAEELAIFENTHSGIHKSVVEAHLREWSSLTPPPHRSNYESIVDLCIIKYLSNCEREGR